MKTPIEKKGGRFKRRKEAMGKKIRNCSTGPEIPGHHLKETRILAKEKPFWGVKGSPGRRSAKRKAPKALYRVPNKGVEASPKVRQGGGGLVGVRGPNGWAGGGKEGEEVRGGNAPPPNFVAKGVKTQKKPIKPKKGSTPSPVETRKKREIGNHYRFRKKRTLGKGF